MALSRIDTTNMIEDVPQSKLDNNINFRNIIINGDMSIAQRATSVSSITSSGYRTVDRWIHNVTTMGTWTLSQSTDVPTGQGFAKSVKWDCTTADASPSGTDRLMFQQYIEGQNLQYLKKGTANAESLTASFWVKSNKTGTYICELRDMDNSRHISKSYTISSADTWEKKTVTFAGDTTGAFDNDNNGSLRLNFWLGTSSTFSSGTLATSWSSYADANRAVGQVNLADSTDNEWYITGVQLEAGTTASDFEFLPHDVNLARCQRYYYLHASNSTSMDIGVGGYYTSSMIFVNVTLPCSMRTAPSVVYDNTTNNYKISRNNSNDLFTDFLGGGSASTNEINLYNNTQVSGTAGHTGYIRTNLSTGSLAFNSEL
jgi:hypothetical protein